MKRFLSALTAFCMCASMATAGLPASALSATSNATAVNSYAADGTVFDKETLYFQDVVYDLSSEDAALDHGVEMLLKVAKNQPTNAIDTDVPD